MRKAITRFQPDLVALPRRLGFLFPNGVQVPTTTEANVTPFKFTFVCLAVLSICGCNQKVPTPPVPTTPGQGTSTELAPDFYAKKRAASAANGDPQAQYNFGLMYENGEGAPRDHAQALKYFRWAAEQGFADALKWFHSAAEQGDAIAQYDLGVMYAFGKGVTRDSAEAVKWYRKAAEQGNADAQQRLGMMYTKGVGVTQDDAEAAKWFRKAAEQEDAAAQYNLGSMYDNGKGVPQDSVEAYAWYSVAASGGNDIAKNSLSALDGTLTPEQLSQGTKRAAELLEKNGSSK